MPGPAHGAPPPTLRGRGFPTRSGQTRARARSHSGGGGVGGLTAPSSGKEKPFIPASPVLAPESGSAKRT